jgi:GT2 family glycosyltransferase
MAFERSHFERIDGFSTRYIYGHYEDADLSFRWAQENGRVLIDPYLRLVHLEGQGSKARGEQYHGAKVANRHLFSLRYNALIEANAELMTAKRDVAITAFPAIA